VPDNDDGNAGIDNTGGGTWKAGVRRTITLNQWEDFAAGTKKSHGYRVIPLHGNYHGMAGYGTSRATASADATTAPSAVLNLRQCGATANTITMCWDAATGADAYDIYRAPTTTTGAVGIWETTALGSDLSVTTYTNKGLDPGDSYWYRVVSKKGSNLVTVGAEAMGSTLEAGSPGAPVGLVVEVAADSNFPSLTERGSLLMWNAPVEGDTAYAYRIERMVNDGSWAPIVSNTQTVIGATQALYTHYNDQKELASDTHAYRVAAISGDGVGPYSNVAYVPAQATHMVPPSGAQTAPSIREPVFVARGLVEVEWTPGDNNGTHIALLWDEEADERVGGLEYDTNMNNREAFLNVPAGTYSVAVISYNANGTPKMTFDIVTGLVVE
jgi:hypothetical protein